MKNVKKLGKKMRVSWVRWVSHEIVNDRVEFKNMKRRSLTEAHDMG